MRISRRTTREFKAIRGTRKYNILQSQSYFVDSSARQREMWIVGSSVLARMSVYANRLKTNIGYKVHISYIFSKTGSHLK